MKKVVLFFPRTLHENNYRNFHVPYSLLSICLKIDKSKYNIEIIDNNVYKKTDYRNYLVENSDSILCVGISCMIGGQIKGVLSFASQVKEINSKIPVIVGGGLPSMLPELIIEKSYVDIIMLGQGEIAFPKLVDSLNMKTGLDCVPNIWYKENGLIHKNVISKYFNISASPSYKQIYKYCNLSSYIHDDEHIGKRTISYHSSQGCPYSCGFCCEVALWNCNWSGVAVNNIFDDILYLKQNYRIDGIKFYDSEFFINHKRSLDFAKLIISKKMEISWAASINPINFMKFTCEELDVLRDSRLKRLLIGIESAVDNERILVGKNFDNNVVSEIAECCKSRNIFVCFTFVTSYPGMPTNNFYKTLAFCEMLANNYPMHEFKLHLYGPYPGTLLYQKSIENGFVPPTTLEEWSEYDYYTALTPWSDLKQEHLIREYNEKYYPYLKGNVK